MPSSILELALSSGLIISGTVFERGASTVSAVAPNDKLVLVHLDRGLRDPGELRGKMVTVAAKAAGIRDKEQAMKDKEDAAHFKEMSHAGRTIAIRDDATHFELRIDGVPIPMVSRLAPHEYATMIFPQQDFPTAEAMAKALAETEGKLWFLDREKGTGQMTPGK